MDSYVKNSEVEMFFRVFSGNELRDFFEEKWEMLKNKIVDTQAFNLKSLFCGSKRNKRIKLNTNKAIIFSQVATINYRGKSNLKKFFGGNHYISSINYRLGKIKSASYKIFNWKIDRTKNSKITKI